MVTLHLDTPEGQNLIGAPTHRLCYSATGGRDVKLTAGWVNINSALLGYADEYLNGFRYLQRRQSTVNFIVFFI